MSTADELTATQMEELCQLLEQARDEVERELSASSEGEKPVDLGLPIGRLSRVDAMQQQQMAAARRRRVEIQRQQIRAALARVQAGTYGECVKCGELIGYARLHARPETPFCKGCQS